MRRLIILSAAFVPAVALAQGAPSVGAGPGADRVITRDQYVQRAAMAAGRRFDQIDVNHTGTITRTQLQTWRAQHGMATDRAGGGMAPGGTNADE